MTVLSDAEIDDLDRWWYPSVTRDAEGLHRLFRQFSFPGGVGSHVTAETPGSIHEGGELGYSLAHAYGAAFDNPDLIVACVVGDGEAETGPLAASWHSIKFLNPATDGAVLPILHLNGYKIANPTVLAGTMPMIGKPEVTARVSRAVDDMDQTIKEIRGAIFALQARDSGSRPDPRSDIVRLVEEMTTALGFAPSLRLGAGLRTLDSEELTEPVLAVLRESLSNVARHAGASRADVTVDVSQDGMLSVTVTDDGAGIPPEEGRRSGLRNLAERAAQLGGELRLGPASADASRPGTRLEWRVPVTAAPSPTADQ